MVPKSSQKLWLEKLSTRKQKELARWKELFQRASKGPFTMKDLSSNPKNAYRDLSLWQEVGWIKKVGRQWVPFNYRPLDDKVKEAKEFLKTNFQPITVENVARLVGKKVDDPEFLESYTPVAKELLTLSESQKPFITRGEPVPAV